MGHRLRRVSRAVARDHKGAADGRAGVVEALQVCPPPGSTCWVQKHHHHRPLTLRLDHFGSGPVVLLPGSGPCSILLVRPPHTGSDSCVALRAQPGKMGVLESRRAYFGFINLA